MTNNDYMELNKLSEDVARDFYRAFVQYFPDIQHELIKNREPNSLHDFVVKIPSANKGFGDIEIQISFEEIAFYIGKHFHTHYDIDVYRTESEIGVPQVIGELIGLIEGIMNDQLLLRVRLNEKRIISTSIVTLEAKNRPISPVFNMGEYLRSIFEMRPRTIFLSWSGNIIIDLNQLHTKKTKAQ